MQIFKNMEIVLMLAFGIVFMSAAMGPLRHDNPMAAGTVGANPAGAAFAARSDAQVPMPEVHIVGRRLSADEKRASIN